MSDTSYSKILLAGCLVIGLVGSVACAKAQSLPIKSLPIYEPCQTLVQGSGDGAVSNIISALKSKDTKTRIQAALQLGKDCDKRAVDPLLDLLTGDPETSVRIAAAEALGRLADQDSIQPMMDLLASQNIQVKTAMTSAFASFPGFKGRNCVVNQIANPSGADIKDDDDMRLRCAAILTACQLKDVSHSRKSILFLSDFLNSPHANIRALAEQTLLELKNTRNGETEMIAIMKQSNNPVLRRWAATWIGKIGFTGIGAREALKEVAASDADLQVKQIAAESLKKLPQ